MTYDGRKSSNLITISTVGSGCLWVIPYSQGLLFKVSTVVWKPSDDHKVLPDHLFSREIELAKSHPPVSLVRLHLLLSVRFLVGLFFETQNLSLLLLWTDQLSPKYIPSSPSAPPYNKTRNAGPHFSCLSLPPLSKTFVRSTLYYSPPVPPFL